MVEKNDIVEVKIDSLAYGGEGVGKIDGFTVFVENSAPGDVLNVRITFKKNTFARGEIVEIVKESPNRVKPECAMVKVCGGCDWQHIEYEAQLKAKRQIVEDSLRRIGGIDAPVRDVLPSDKIYGYRCKVQNPVQQTEVSKRLLLGYYKKGTHELVNIKHCPIQPDLIEEVAEYIRDKGQELGITAYDKKGNTNNKKAKKGLLRHVVFRYSMSDNNLIVIFVINSDNVSRELRELAASCKDKFPEIAGVLANFNTRDSNVILGQKMALLEGVNYVEEHMEDRVYRITAGSFFQVNPMSAIKMFNTVKNMINERLDKPTILDVYAGVASFAIWLKDSAKTMTAIEEYPQAVIDAKVNIDLNKHIEGADIEMVGGNADEVLESYVKDGKKYEVVILDPPRKGCAPIAIESAAKLAEKYIIYVSCNPTTLARDLRLLDDLGFETEYVQPVDMFCHTYHVESIALIKRK